MNFRPEYRISHHSHATRDARKRSARLPTPTHLASGTRKCSAIRGAPASKAKGSCASSLARAQEPLASGRRRRPTTERRGRREERAIGVGCGGVAPVSVGSRLRVGPPGSRSSADAGHVAGPASKRVRGDERPPQLEGMGLGGCTSRPCAEGVPTGTLGGRGSIPRHTFVVVMVPTRNEPKAWNHPLTSGLTY